MRKLNPPSKTQPLHGPSCHQTHIVPDPRPWLGKVGGSWRGESLQSRGVFRIALPEAQQTQGWILPEAPNLLPALQGAEQGDVKQEGQQSPPFPSEPAAQPALRSSRPFISAPEQAVKQPN